jgi:diguanylate cyclase (GGDEF)-like protein
LIECRIRRPSGDYFWVEANLRAIPDPITGAPTGILNIVRDIGERKATEQARDMHLSLIAAIQEVSLDGVLVVNDQGKVISYNKRFSEVWKITAPTLPATLWEGNVDISDEQLLGQCVDQTKDPASFLRRVLELYADHSANEQSQIELKDGRTLERYSTSLLGQNGKYLGRVWFFRDISERKRGEKELRAAYCSLETLAATDPLTGLANRRRFDQTLSGEWRRGAREHSPLSIVLMDADWFKTYNDTYGHMSGDKCLRQIADAIRGAATRSGDLAGRIGGEEFAVILPNTPANGAREVAEQICAALRSRRLPHSSNPVGYVTISVGCATLMPALGQRSATLLQRADEAMYAAKRSGRNRICEADSIDPDCTSLQAS